MAVAAMKHMASSFAKLEKFERVDFRRWQKEMHFMIFSKSLVYVLTTPMQEDGDAPFGSFSKPNALLLTAGEGGCGVADAWLLVVAWRCASHDGSDGVDDGGGWTYKVVRWLVVVRRGWCGSEGEEMVEITMGGDGVDRGEVGVDRG
nr:zinc finger, CCHC-type [Tanacetum cinerariifolium]